MNIINNLDLIKDNIPSNVILVAVSKTKPNTDILTAYNAGQKIFGENKVQELVQKQKELPHDIKWHMIGHLQRNKVKYIAPFVNLIHAVDSIRLLQEINKRAAENNRTIDCLLQIHIATEKTKFGFDINEIENTIKKANSFTNINIKGLMGMATFTKNQVQINTEFKKIHKLFKIVKTKMLDTLSIGMSNDYKLAINHGSTMVRIGSDIFGKRQEI
tara:strand:+ start:8206 stop:8853 length:648 start_codon:yes stop_codon:yes gene_type:complete